MNTYFCMKKHINVSRTIIHFLILYKAKDRKIRGQCNLLIKVKFHELERSSPVI